MADGPIYYAEPAGSISYNGVVLNPTAQYSLTSLCVMDDANRTYKYTEYTIQGKFVIFGDEGSAVTETICSNKMQEIRDKLNQPGKALLLSNIGFGSGDINGTSRTAIKDVNFGPKPEVMNYGPFGSTAWEVIWNCKYYVTEPDTANANSILALNYDLSFTHDARGLTTINISGHYQIPLSAADYKVNLSDPRRSQLECKVDKFMDQLTVKIPEDFRLGEHTHSYNATRNRCDFAYQIIEADGEAYPPGIVWADIDEDWENAEPQSFSGWNGSIRGELEVAKGYPTTTAARKFLDIFVQRLTYIRGQVNNRHGGGKSTPAVLPIRFSFGCKRFTRKYRFSAEYSVIGCIPDFIKASGIWQPLGTSHADWVASMVEVQNNRGVSKVKPGVEIILNTGNVGQNQKYPITFSSTKPIDAGDSSTLTFDCAGINEQNSYLDYENHVRVVRQASVSISKYAQSPGNSEGTDFQNGNSSPGSFGSSQTAKILETIVDAANFFNPVQRAIDSVGTAISTQFSSTASPNSNGSGKPDTIEYTGTTTDYLVMSGKALRIKYPPQAPTITKIASSTAALIEEQVEAPSVIGMIGDCAVYSMRWAKVYYVPGGFVGKELSKTTPAGWACLQPFG
jgi:hypothetical protein